MLAAHILEIDVDAVRAGGGERGFQVPAGPVVDRGVHPGLVAEPGAFLVRAGGADHAAALQLGDLADDRADRARGRRDEHRLALLRPADVEQADIGRLARHAEHADIGLERRDVRIDGPERLAVGRMVVAPAPASAEHMRARGKASALRLLDAPDEIAVQRLADLERRRIALPVADAPADIGIDRHPERADQHFALAGDRHGRGLQGEILGRRQADGPAFQDDLTVFGHRASLLIGRRRTMPSHGGEGKE